MSMMDMIHCEEDVLAWTTGTGQLARTIRRCTCDMRWYYSTSSRDSPVWVPLGCMLEPVTLVSSSLPLPPRVSLILYATSHTDDGRMEQDIED